jgi:hypothetical protein
MEPGYDGCPYYDGAFDVQQVRLCRDNGAVECLQVLVNRVLKILDLTDANFFLLEVLLG